MDKRTRRGEGRRRCALEGTHQQEDSATWHSSTQEGAPAAGSAGMFGQSWFLHASHRKVGHMRVTERNWGPPPP
eukprot:1145401-Pelagomonas_calceolata.AAC.15